MCVLVRGCHKAKNGRVMAKTPGTSDIKSI